METKITELEEFNQIYIEIESNKEKKERGNL